MKICFLLTCILGVVLQQVYGDVRDVKYKVTVKTGGCTFCGTDDDVFVRIVGKNGKTVSHELASSGDDFDKGDEYTYSFGDPKYVGDFIAVEVKKAHKIISNDWNMEWMRISYGSGQEFYFRYGKYVPNERWFTVFVTCPDGYVKNQQGYCEDVRHVKYKVTVKTGGCTFCGTNDDVFIRIVGKNGKTASHELASSGDDFDKGDEDTYYFSDAKYVGDFIAVEVKKTHKIVSNDWNLQWMRISYGKGQDFYFRYGKYVPNERWFTVFVTCRDGYVKNQQGYCEG